jgi:hypothetical protein
MSRLGYFAIRSVTTFGSPDAVFAAGFIAAGFFAAGFEVAFIAGFGFFVVGFFAGFFAGFFFVAIRNPTTSCDSVMSA